LLNDDEQRRSMGARGAARAAQFDWRAIAARLESIYCGLLVNCTNADNGGGRSASRPR
jgi:glycosyltransferase involved in cell wall biosynthesis